MILLVCVCVYRRTSNQAFGWMAQRDRDTKPPERPPNGMRILKAQLVRGPEGRCIYRVRGFRRFNSIVVFGVSMTRKLVCILFYLAYFTDFSSTVLCDNCVKKYSDACENFQQCFNCFLSTKFLWFQYCCISEGLQDLPMWINFNLKSLENR